MILGNKLKFAIEYELDKQYGGEWLFGKFCYWIGGQCIGNYDLGTSLRDVLFQVESILRDNGNRTNNKLFILDSIDLFNRLNNALYACDIDIYDSLAIEETWARHNVSLPIDILDDWKIFMVENNTKIRIIIKNVLEQSIKETTLVPGEFDNVISELFKELNSFDSEIEKN